MGKPIGMGKTVRELGEMKLVGVRVLCPGDQFLSEIPKASHMLSKRINEIKHVVHPLLQFGAFVVENQSAEEDGYWVCVEVNEYDDIPSDLVTLTVPPQRYAVSRHKGANDQIMNWYEELHAWIDDNNYSRRKEKWHLEKFYSWHDPENVELELFDTIE